MTDKELRRSFRGLVEVFQYLGGIYFFTEFFILDKVEQSLKIYSNRKTVLRLRRMARIKYGIRMILNNLYNYKKIFKPHIDAMEKRLGRTDLAWLSYEEIIQLCAGNSVPISDR